MTELAAPLLDADLDLGAQLVAIRRHLHAHPELGFEEFETADFIAGTLAAWGLAPHRIATTGVFVDIAGDHPGPLLGYRADIDALPIEDAKVDVPYRSTRAGVAHLCGHDAHTAIGLGVARLLAGSRDRLRGTVRVFFQPNEEGTPSGAPLMIEGGVLDGMQAVYGIHVDPTLEVGRYGLIKGPVTASADRFDITVRGPATGHSARPHATVDTVWVSTMLAAHLYTLSGRITDARRPSVLTICRYHAGDAYNVIPRETGFGGTLRCVDAPTRRQMQDACRAAARAFAAMHDCHVACDFHNGAPPVVNDAALVDHVEATIRARRGDEAVFHYELPSMGAEDFAFYTERIPGAFVRVGTRSSERTSHPVHAALFDLDEAALEPAARLMADVLLLQPDL